MMGRSAVAVRTLAGLLVFGCLLVAVAGITVRMNREVMVPNSLRAASFETSTVVPVPLRRLPVLYYITIYVGTPAQPFNVQLDTGSSNLAIYSASCENCGVGGNLPYNAFTSRTAQIFPCISSSPYGCTVCSSALPNQCGFSLLYGDGSGVTGPVVTDVVGIGGGIAANVTFGQIYSAIGNFEQAPLDGIMGIGYPRLACSSNSQCVTPALDAIFASNGLPQIFSLCLGSVQSTQAGGGVFSVGGDDAQFYTGSIAYTPITSQTYYVVSLTDIAVGGVSLGLSNMFNGQTIVDSGTTDLIIPQAVYNALSQAVFSACPNCPDVFSLCATLSNAQMAAFPTVTFSLGGGVVLQLPPSAYLLRGAAGGCPNTMYAAAVAAGSDSVLILGDTVMRQYYIVFDRVAQRVGFATPRNCDNPCASATTCTSCAALSMCGWCASAGQCQLSAGPAGVQNPTCAGGWSAGTCPASAITTVVPNFGNSAGGNMVTVTGTSLGSGSDITSVTFGGQAAVIVSQSATSVVARIAPSPLTGSLIVDVVVRSMAFGIVTRTGGYTYDHCLSFSSCGTCKASTGCGWCQSSGSCLSGVTGGPSGATCTGSGSWIFAATTCPASAISTVTPTYGAVAGNTLVTLTGSAFGSGTDITSVTLAGVAATIQSQTTSNVVVRTAAAAGVVASLTGSAVVTSTSLGATSLASAFTFDQCLSATSCSSCTALPWCGWCEATRTCTAGATAGPLFATCPALCSWSFGATCPVVLGVVPMAGSPTGDYMVTINGLRLTNMTDLLSVTLAGVSAPVQAVMSDNRIVVRAGAVQVGPVGVTGPVHVTSSCSGSVGGLTFSYTTTPPAAPTISSVAFLSDNSPFIYVTFDTAISGASTGPSMGNICASLLSAGTLAIMGSNPFCLWTSQTTLLIGLGSGSNVVVGTPMNFLPNVIQSTLGSAYMSNVTLSVLPPTAPTTVIIIVVVVAAVAIVTVVVIACLCWRMRTKSSSGGRKELVSPLI